MKRPALVNVYNSKMGVVDLHGVHTVHKSAQNQALVSISVLPYTHHGNGQCLVFYHHDCKLRNIKEEFPLKAFQAQAVDALIKRGSLIHGCPSAEFLKSPLAKKQKLTPSPTIDVRYDMVDQWSELIGEKHNCCRLCLKGFS